jgi:hypothetical protein
VLYQPVLCTRDVNGQFISSGRSSQGLLLFLANLAYAVSATELAERARQASTATRPRVATASGQRLALFIGGRQLLERLPESRS